MLPLTYNRKNENRYLLLSYWKDFQKCLLNGPLPNISFLSKPLNFNGCHGNQKEKKKIGIYCYLIADILRNFFQKCLLSGPLPSIIFVQTLNFNDCHGNQKAKFAKNILINQILRSNKDDKAETLLRKWS